MPLFGSPGQRIGYAIHPGPPGAPPLLLLHGFTASAASFVSNLPGLTERFTVITAELLGHGDSDAPDDPAAYAPGPAMDRLLGLLDHLGYEQVLLCGHSLGGALALRIALEAPERFAGLVVINSNSAAGSPDWRETVRASMREMAARIRAQGIEPLRQTRLYPAQGTRLPEEARQLLTRDFDRLQPAGIAGTAESLVVDVNAFERLGELTVPTLVVIGDRDTDFARNAPRFLVRLPHDLVDTFTIEGAGHAANLEQPDLFNEALFAFAERIGFLTPLDGPQDSVAPSSGGTHLLTDDDLGPTIYEEIAQSLGTRSRQVILGATGASLIVLGAGLIAAAFLVGGDSDGGQRAIAGTSSRTPTVVEQAAGVRTAAPSSAPTSATTAVAAAQPSMTPSAASPTQAPPTSTPSPTAPPPPASTPTPEPSATPAEPTPTATQAPSGPSVTINGPTSGAVGQLLTFSASVSGNDLRLDWSASNGQSARLVPAFSVTFLSSGCHSVTLTALFGGGLTRTATHAVAIGVDTCD